jgi:FlgD Ig-like domain
VAPFADVTSPRDVTRQEGGEVFTAEGDARLYLQPGALDRDAQVTLVGAPALPAATPPLPSGAGVVRRWYEVAWPGATLLKAATLDLTPAGPAGKLAAHRYRPEDGWTRLGGTPMDSTGLTLAIDRDGGYAVVEEATVAPEGGFTIAELRFSPRLFTPGRGGAAGALSIAFDLGRAATVDVRVHNRAGRLVNEVARGTFAAGSNLVTWDGRDRNGQTVPGGLYVVTVEALGDRLQNTIVVSP